MISHVELRSEESDDIKPYVFGRNVEKIVVPLSSELKEAKAEFLKVGDGFLHWALFNIVESSFPDLFAELCYIQQTFVLYNNRGNNCRKKS